MNGKNWHDDDSTWDKISAVIFSESKMEKAPLEVEQITSLAGMEPGMLVLDLCCGVGRHSVELARRGFRVTAVDRTARYLELARKRAAQADVHVEFIQQDMREFRRPGAFDAVVNLFTSFGYFEDPRDDSKVIRNVQKSLKPGGVFLIDIMGKEILARIFRERHWEQDGDVTVLQTSRVEKNWSWIRSHWIILLGESKKELEIQHRIFSAVELCALIEESGLSVENVYGSFEGAPYDHRAERLIIKARKPAG